jgi:hypothetical protein
MRQKNSVIWIFIGPVGIQMKKCQPLQPRWLSTPRIERKIFEPGKLSRRTRRYLNLGQSRPGSGPRAIREPLSRKWLLASAAPAAERD